MIKLLKALALLLLAAVPASASQDPRAEAVKIATTPLPAWAATYKTEIRPDGRIWLHATIEGIDIWAQPMAWKELRIEVTKPEPSSTPDPERSKETGTMNYGINLQEMRTHNGKLETNSAQFGEQFLAASESSSPLPTGPARDYGQYGPSVFLLAVAVVVIALIYRKRRAG